MDSNSIMGFILSFVIINLFFYLLFYGDNEITKEISWVEVVFHYFTHFKRTFNWHLSIAAYDFYISTLFIPSDDGAIGLGFLMLYIGKVMLIPLGILDVISIVLYLVVIYHRTMRKGEAVA